MKENKRSKWTWRILNLLSVAARLAGRKWRKSAVIVSHSALSPKRNKHLYLLGLITTDYTQRNYWKSEVWTESITTKWNRRYLLCFKHFRIQTVQRRPLCGFSSTTRSNQTCINPRLQSVFLFLFEHLHPFPTTHAPPPLSLGPVTSACLH